MNPTVISLVRMGRILSGLVLLSACGEPLYEYAGSSNSLLEDREACMRELEELEQSPEARDYRQNPTAPPDYMRHVFADTNRCIERKGWKLLSAQPQQIHEPARSEFAQAGRPAPDSAPKAIGVIREFNTRSSDIPSVADR